jgi:hypothetical protein
VSHREQHIHESPTRGVYVNNPINHNMITNVVDIDGVVRKFDFQRRSSVFVVRKVDWNESRSKPSIGLSQLELIDFLYFLKNHQTR